MKNVIVNLVLLVGCFTAWGVTNVSNLSQGHDILWKQLGPSGGGWYESVAFSPSSPNIICVGTDVGGFMISLDGGQTFQVRNNGLTDYFIERIAINPSNTNIIILAAAGGIFRTTDSGLTWAPMTRGTGTPFPLASQWDYSAPMNAVCFDPQNSNTVFAGQGRTRGNLTNGGTRSGNIYKSIDCGLTWSLVSSGQTDPQAIINDIAVKPDASNIVLVASDKGMYRSNDGGGTWSQANNGLGSNLNIDKISFAPSLSNTVYITVKTTARDSDPWNGGIYKSDDAGQSWSNVTGDFPKVVGPSTGAEYLTTSPKDIIVHPSDPNTLFVANCSWEDRGIYKTVNSGLNWNNLINSGNVSVGWAYPEIGAPFAFTMYPNDPNRLFGVDSMQMYITTDGGVTWNQKYCNMLGSGFFSGNGANILCAWDIVFAANNPNRIYCCYADTGLLISDNKGKTYRQANNSGCVYTVAVDPATTPRVIWAASNLNPKLQISNDDGVTWTSCVTGLPQNPGNIHTIILDLTSSVNNRRLLITVTGSGVYQSTNNGSSWNCINGNLSTLVAISSPSGLLLDPKNNQHMVLALGGNPSDGAGVYGTTNGGAQWNKLNSASLFSDIHALQTDPKFFNVLYIGQRYAYVSGQIYDGGVFQSIDGGITWTQLLEGDLCSDVKVNPVDTNVLYALFSSMAYHDNDFGQGVVRSADRGQTWQTELDGLPIFNLQTIGVNPCCPEEVYGGTSGSSDIQSLDKCAVPLVRWKLDEVNGSLTASDSSGFSHNGTITGAGTRVSGVVNNAIQLCNGEQIVLSRANAPNRSKGITIAAWTNMVQTGSQTNSYVMWKTNSYMLKQGWGGGVSFGIYINGTYYSTTLTHSVTTNQWTHLAGAYSEETQTINLYINGICVEQVVLPTGLSTYAIDDNNNDVVTSVAGTGNTRIIDMDDIRLYNYDVDSNTIKDMADKDMFLDITFLDPETSTTITDSSIYGCDGSLSGTSYYVFNNLKGQALALANTSTVTVPATAMPACQDAVSICGWIYFAQDGYQNNSNVFNKASAYTLGAGWGRSTKFCITVNGVVYATPIYTLPVQQWCHVAGTYGTTDRTLRLYVNGVLQTTTVLSGLQTYQVDTNANSGAISTNGTSGRIAWFDNVRVYKRVLTQAEITALSSN